MSIELLIKEKSKTPIGNKLVKILTEIWDNNDFILGCLVDLDDDDKKQKLINLIEQEGINDSDTIILASLDIADGEL